MFLNNNLKNISPYKIEILKDGIKRQHCNESKKTILPLEVLLNGIENNFLNLYPDIEYNKLINCASRFYNLESDFCIPVNGSDEALEIIIRTCCNHNDSVVLLNPTFSMYKQYSIVYGLKVHEFSLQQEGDFILEIDKFIKFCSKIKPKIIFIPNPTIPTGKMIKKKDF